MRTTALLVLALLMTACGVPVAPADAGNGADGAGTDDSATTTDAGTVNRPAVLVGTWRRSISMPSDDLRSLVTEYTFGADGSAVYTNETTHVAHSPSGLGSCVETDRRTGRTWSVTGNMLTIVGVWTDVGTLAMCEDPANNAEQTLVEPSGTTMHRWVLSNGNNTLLLYIGTQAVLTYTRQ